jgi:hypothetical protein
VSHREDKQGRRDQCSVAILDSACAPIQKGRQHMEGYPLTQSEKNKKKIKKSKKKVSNFK